jgi:hypothetical protein
MVREYNTPTRDEVTERVERARDDMEGKEVDLDRFASELETVRQTLENLDFKGTSEGSEQIESFIESAEDVAENTFGEANEGLDCLQNESEGFEGELQDRQNASESDLGKVSDSSAQIETKETINELMKVKETVIRDIDFLAEQVSRASEAREKSNAVQERLQSQINAGKRGK